MKQSYVFLANGFEDIEAITIIDLLRRAEIPVKTVSINDSLEVESTHGVVMKADMLLDGSTIENPGWLILPGGLPGADNLYKSKALRELLIRQFNSPNGRIAAICASPAVVLGQMGLLKGENATCYPGFEEMLQGAVKVDVPVVKSEKFVLGNGPASAMSWALSVIEAEKGETVALRIADNLLFYPRSEADVDYSFG